MCGVEAAALSDRHTYLDEVGDDRAVMAPPRPEDPRYRGLSCRDASRMGNRLVSAALRTGCWVHLPEHLTILRGLIQRHDRRAA